MRISEIKQCIDDEKVLQCVKKDFWEDEYYKIPLTKEKNLCDISDIYFVIKNAYLEMLDCPGDTNTLYKHRKRIRRLSKLVYRDPSYWAKGTKWENIEFDFKDRLSPEKRQENISFLYDRFKLTKINKDFDIVYLISRCETFYEGINIYEETEDQINDLFDLYNICEKVALTLIKKRKLTYFEYKVMRSISYLTYQDARFFFKNNNLEFESVVEHSKDKENRDNGKNN